MATTDHEERAVKLAGQEGPVEEDSSATAPQTTNPLRLDGVGSQYTTPDTREIHDQSSEPAHSKGIDLMDSAYDVPAIEEDSMRTPKLEQPALVFESLASKLSNPVQDKDQQHCQGDGYHIARSRHADYFTQQVPQDSVATDISRTPSSSNVSSTGLSGSTNSQLDTSSTPVSPDSRASTWKDYLPSFNPEGNRPVSVPNLQSKPMSRRREGPEYPNYPDQSFKALQDQQYPPYRSGEPHHLRTRSSQPSHTLSFALSDEAPVRGFPATSSGAKTVGNTPAQSPGLFMSNFSKQQWSSELDEARSSTPMLHPAHLQEPKE